MGRRSKESSGLEASVEAEVKRRVPRETNDTPPEGAVRREGQKKDGWRQTVEVPTGDFDHGKSKC